MAISLTLKVSDGLRGWLIAGHVIPLPLFFIYGSLPLALLAALLAVCALLVCLLRFNQLSGPRRVCGIQCRDQQWYLNLESGQKLDVALLSWSGFGTLWQLLDFVDGRGRNYRVFVTRDNTDQAGFRKLRTYLRLQYFTETAG